MARKRKGNPVHGWLVVDKPLGITSAAVVNKARWALNAQKAGHSGTLDPDASGCLAIAFGEATKVIPVAQDGLKTYRFTVRWGQSTSTDDAQGEVVETRETLPDEDQIAAALPPFVGDILQVPPKVSAVKVDGQRAYDLAREGEEVELQPRPLRVERLEHICSPDRHHSEFELVCGKGGYVRSIARDLGEALGCLGHVTLLRRLSTGPFDLSDSIAFDTFDGYRASATLPLLLPVEAGLAGLFRVPISQEEAEDLRHGRAISTQEPDRPSAWASLEGEAVALGEVRSGAFFPSRVILPR